MFKVPQSSWLLGALRALVSASLVAFSLSRLGMPLTLYTWIVVAVAACSGVTLALRKRRRILFAASALFCIYLSYPDPFQYVPLIEKYSLFDDAGGREGWAISPYLKFGGNGRNTALMESYVGQLEPHWFYQAPHSPYVMDGNERVHSRSVIRHEYFPALLRMLPHDEARRAVILALTDPENRLRVHQGLLLTCLYVFKYPAGTDSEIWWLHHQDLFRSERNPLVAASLTQGWLKKAQDLSWPPGEDQMLIERQSAAAENQERGQWGGNQDFSDAFRMIAGNTMRADATALAIGQKVIWWPERRKAVDNSRRDVD